jgi:hypothetical protein
MDETRTYHDEAMATERWFASPRFRETARPYTAQVSSRSKHQQMVGWMWMWMRRRSGVGNQLDLGPAARV